MLTIQKSGVQASLHPSLQRNGELFVSRRSFFSATGEKFLKVTFIAEIRVFCTVG
jgi:hypothetical protein